MKTEERVSIRNEKVEKKKRRNRESTGEKGREYRGERESVHGRREFKKKGKKTEE
jgi:hypothetical protein